MDVLCTEVHKRREKMRGGKRVDVRRNESDHAVCMWLHKSELCLCVIIANSVKNIFLNGSKRNETGINIPEFVR